MEELLKQELGTSKLKTSGRGGGGCISEGLEYETDHGRVFIKMNSKSGARLMFDGEFASLQAMHAAGEVRVPRPIKVVNNPEGGAVLVMECLDISSLHSYASLLGQQLANLHKKNAEIGKQIKKDESSLHRDPELAYIDKFGFDVSTCCGYIPQCNEWTDSWVQFYARKIEDQIKSLESEAFNSSDCLAILDLGRLVQSDLSHGDRLAREQWTQILPSLSKFFTGLNIQPALLHGDLWSGNAGQLTDGPVIYDPASFYGHAEYDLGIANLFGGFGSSFFNSYFKVLPKQQGYESRLQLYLLFHNLNHWNHFGGGYKSSSIRILKSLVKELKKS